MAEMGGRWFKMAKNELKVVEKCRTWPKMGRKLPKRADNDQKITENVPKMVENGGKWPENGPKIAKNYQK